ncbi:MAG: DNA polymerase III subunit delta [Firmicutes bacterium]|nr:DNA polymerase III subunit delta [Bacillota bacterium]
MMHLIISSDQITIQTRIKEIKQQILEAEVVQYDLKEVPIEKLIEDLDTFNFLSGQKIIIGHNAYFLTTEKPRGVIEHNLSKFEKYMENPSPDNTLILICDSLDKRKKITTAYCKKAKVWEEDISIREILIKSKGEHQVNNEVIDYLIEYCGNDNGRILQEWEKLKIYTSSSLVILKEDVETIVSKNIDDSIFTLVDDLLKGNKKSAFKIYQELILHGELPTNIISKLANKIRLIYQVKVFSKTGRNDQEISKTLNMHPYPVKLAREASYQYSDSILLDYLEKLAEIDYMMKSGNTQQDILLETFIASM